MRKGKLLALAMAVAVLIPVFNPSTVYAAESHVHDGIEVNLGEFYFTTSDYNEDEVSIETIKNDANEVSVNIVDKETGSILETITSAILSKDSEELRSIDVDSSRTTSYYTIQRNRTDGPVSTRLDCVVILYKSGSFSSVNSIEGTSMYITSSNSATLESVYSYGRSVSGTFPSTHIEFLGSGVITITTEITSGDELSIGFSIPEVMELGYSVSSSTTSTVYLRKAITIQGEFYTYSTGPTQ